tara:strand:- start:45 stop:2207 length:2163 start_codon:yes stop_codon:yes gene_type:complete
MATIEEIDSEIAKRSRIAEIDKAIAQRQGSAMQSITEPLGSMGGNLLGLIGSGLAGITEAIKTGDLNAAANKVKEIQQQAQQQFSPETESGRAGLQRIMSILAPIEQVINTGLSGTAGLADVAFNPVSNITQGFEPAKQTVRNVRDQGLGKSSGQQVLNATNSPALATLTEVAPAAVELVAGGLLGRKAGRATVASAQAKTAEAQRALDDLSNGVVKETTVQDVAKTVQSGNADDIAAIVDADPEFFRAADELGLSTEPLASFASRNPQFRDVEQALATVPGNVLDPQSKLFIAEVSQKADDLIIQYGGTTDKAQLGIDFQTQSMDAIDDLFKQADEAYGTLKQVLPPAQRFEATRTVDFILSKADELGGVDQLPAKLKSILSALNRVDNNGALILPTLGKIDQIRREVGQALGKGSGPFKDVETGLNKALYARLTKDQDLIAEEAGGEALAVSDTAKSLVVQRKQIEDNLQFLLGKNLNNALSVTVGGAIKNLSKGEVEKFADIMNAIPAHKRGEIVMSAMNDVFKGSGVNQQSLNPTQFVKWYQTINRSPATKKVLFDALPLGSKKAIDNLYEVSRGISRALGQKTPTGRINALFNNETGFIRKMVGRSLSPLASFATGSPVASVMASGAAEMLIKQSTNGAKAASDLMGSPQFQNIIRLSVKEGVVDGAKASEALKKAESALMKTKRYQKWANVIMKDDLAALSGGLLTYLFQQEDR